jgi:hypothetical protein
LEGSMGICGSGEGEEENGYMMGQSIRGLMGRCRVRAFWSAVLPCGGLSKQKQLSNGD